MYVFCSTLGLPVANEKIDEKLHNLLQSESQDQTILTQLKLAIKTHLSYLSECGNQCGYDTQKDLIELISGPSKQKNLKKVRKEEDQEAAESSEHF